MYSISMYYKGDHNDRYGYLNYREGKRVSNLTSCPQFFPCIIHCLKIISCCPYYKDYEQYDFKIFKKYSRGKDFVLINHNKEIICENKNIGSLKSFLERNK